MVKWTTFHPSVFLLTFMSYALYHMVRKTPSYVQTSLINEWTPQDYPQSDASSRTMRDEEDDDDDLASSIRVYGVPSSSLSDSDFNTDEPAQKQRDAGGAKRRGAAPAPAPQHRPSLFPDQQSAEAFVGVLNAVFLFVYAGGNLLSGMLADRMDHRLMLTAGMTLAALVMFVFGPVLEWTGTRSKAAYLALEVLSALCQSTGWPCLVPVMAAWFDKRSRGYFLGLWSSSSSVGSVLGALLVSEVLGYGYEFAFVLTCSLLLSGAVLIFFGLVVSPAEVGLELGTAEQLYDVEVDDGCKNDDGGDEYDDDRSGYCFERGSVRSDNCRGHKRAEDTDLSDKSCTELTDRSNNCCEDDTVFDSISEKTPLLGGRASVLRADVQHVSYQSRGHTPHQQVARCDKKEKKKNGSASAPVCGDHGKKLSSKRTRDGPKPTQTSPCLLSRADTDDHQERCTDTADRGVGNERNEDTLLDKSHQPSESSSRRTHQEHSSLVCGSHIHTPTVSGSCKDHLLREGTHYGTDPYTSVKKSSNTHETAIKHPYQNATCRDLDTSLKNTVQAPQSSGYPYQNTTSNSSTGAGLNTSLTPQPTDDHENQNTTTIIKDFDKSLNNAKLTPRSSQEEENSYPKNTSKDSTKDSSNTITADTTPAAIGLCGALLLPGVLPYCCCFFFLKLVVYVFFFWLPFYLASAYGWSESTADRLSLFLDLGGIVGASASAFLMSRLKKSALVMTVMMVPSVILLYVYGVARAGSTWGSNATILFWLGFLLLGVANHLSAAVSADLGQRRAVTGNVRAMSTVAGLLEGCGTVGAAFGQVAVPYLYGGLGWDAVYWGLMGAVGVSVLALTPIMIAEVKDVIGNWQQQQRRQRDLNRI